MSNAISHPAHYNQGKIEVIEFIEDKNLNFHLGNAVKYICRAGKKDPSKHQEDLEKAIWYVEREIEFKFSMNVRRPNDMRQEPPLSPREAVKDFSHKDQAQKLITIKGMLHDLFMNAAFDEWESLGDQIGEVIENNPRIQEFKKWEEYQEERKELLELCRDYGIEHEGGSNSELRDILRPDIQSAFDCGKEIGLLEKEIIDEQKPKKSVKKPKLPSSPPAFPHDYVTRDL